MNGYEKLLKVADDLIDILIGDILNLLLIIDGEQVENVTIECYASAFSSFTNASSDVRFFSYETIRN